VSSGVWSSGITVQVLDQYDNAVVDTGLPINLATSTGTGQFSSSSSGSPVVPYVTVGSGLSTATFYYMDTNAGNPTLTITATGLTQAQITTITIQ
jgi:hypothetical protein